MTHEMQLGDCYARASNTEIVLGNSAIERRWQLRAGAIFAHSFLDRATGLEWLARPDRAGAPQLSSQAPEPGEWSFRFRTGPQNAVESTSLVLEAYARGGGAQHSAALRLQIFPGVAAVSVQRLTATTPLDDWQTDLHNETLCVPALAAPAHQHATATNAPTATGIETPPTNASDLPTEDILEHFDLSPRHLRLVQVELRDQTDIRNELVFEREWLLHPNEATLELQGNLFICEDPLTGRGLIFLKEAPLPSARPHPTPVDFRMSPHPALYYDSAPSEAFGPAHPKWPLCYRVALYGHGTGPAGGLGYRWVTLAYAQGKVGRTHVLQQYQRSRRTFDPTRDARFMSNTWGDRSRDTRINSTFITQEIVAGARLGVDIAQIDDGWQQGVTSNSAQAQQRGGVWEGYYQADPDFWAVNAQRFPQGLQPVIANACAHAMGLGLWFSPDSSHDLKNWPKDAQVILALHRTYGVNYFKIDGVKARTRLGEYRLHRFFDQVLEASHGQVVFDLDVTAEIRPGYFGLLHTGPLFVENRYTDFHRYWPHQTLRNLWKLAHYVDPLRLRMEFLNPARHRGLYQNDPLAPHTYPPAYLFATVMCSNPLGWFEVSNLDESMIQDIAPLARLWQAHRPAFFSNTIHPIGETPDGAAWTGFLSIPSATAAPAPAYLVLFRELNDRPTWTCPLPLPAGGAFTTTILAGSGSASVTRGTLTTQMEKPQSFLFARIDPIPPHP